MISFTRRYHDKTSNHGFQFQFFCDRSTYNNIWTYKECSSSFLSTLRPNPIGIASTLTQAASYLLGRGYGVGVAGHLINDVYKSQAWQDAYKEAIDEVKPHFNQCGRCSAWVCKANCWNDAQALCTSCAPPLGNEIASAKAKAAKEQINRKAREVDHVSEVDLNAAARCSHCNARSTGGKFCSSCGKEMLMRPSFCASCGKKLPGDPKAKFCMHCGDTI